MASAARAMRPSRAVAGALVAAVALPVALPVALRGAPPVALRGTPGCCAFAFKASARDNARSFRCLFIIVVRPCRIAACFPSSGLAPTSSLSEPVVTFVARREILPA
jgi:hypothetical protein